MNLKLPKRVHVEMILHLAKDFLEDEDHSVVSEVKEACEKALNPIESIQIDRDRARCLLMLLNVDCNHTFADWGDLPEQLSKIAKKAESDEKK